MVGEITITPERLPALARQLADDAIQTLDSVWEILERCGPGWRETMVNSVSAEIQKRLTALAVPAPKPPAPSASDLAATALALAALPHITCPKCARTIPVGAMCKGIDCPLIAGWQDEVVETGPVLGALQPRRGFVEVTPPQAGRGSTVPL